MEFSFSSCLLAHEIFWPLYFVRYMLGGNGLGLCVVIAIHIHVRFGYYRNSYTKRSHGIYVISYKMASVLQIAAL